MSVINRKQRDGEKCRVSVIERKQTDGEKCHVSVIERKQRDVNSRPHYIGHNAAVTGLTKGEHQVE